MANMLMNTLGRVCPKAELWHFQNLCIAQNVTNLAPNIRQMPYKRQLQSQVTINTDSLLLRQSLNNWPSIKRPINSTNSNIILTWSRNYESLVPQIHLISNGPINKTNAKKTSQNTQRCLSVVPDDKNPFPKRKRRVPKLILIQNPLTWLVTRFDFGVLKNVWDPTFDQKEFKIGTKQAISRVTHIISEGRFADLSGLLTRAARLSLVKEIERAWTGKQKQLIAMSNDDIQITSPRKVYFIRIADKRYCDVDMAFLALKWASMHRSDGLVFAEIFARFHREYTPYCIPEWTIAYFKVTRFDILRKT